MSYEDDDIDDVYPDDEDYQERVKKDLIIAIREYRTFSSEKELLKLIKEYS